MVGNEIKGSMAGKTDRRAFLKALGALGVGAAAGGVAQSIFKVIDVDGELPAISRTRVAMGTYVTVTALHPSRARADEAVELAFDKMDRLIAILSRHESSGPLAVLNSQGSLAGPPPELSDVLAYALDVHQGTGGVFDPTVLPLLRLKEESAQHGLPSEGEIRDALERVGAEHVRVSDAGIEFARPGMSVTLDGVAKGYIVDRMSVALETEGVSDYIVNAGGDIRTGGERARNRPWKVAIQDPRKQGNYPDVIRVNDGAIATSGGYENSYDDEGTSHHLVDPRSGRSPQRCLSATVRAGSVTVADALATALMVLGVEDGLGLVNSLGGVESLVVDAQGGRHRSRGWSGESA